MINVEHIEGWRGQPVLDPAGEQLGKLEEIYFDKSSGTPLLAAVKSGLLGRHSKLVPIDGASVSRDYVRVVHDKATVDAAPEAAGDTAPDPAALDAVGAAYGLKFSERVELETSGEAETRRAEAEAASPRRPAGLGTRARRSRPATRPTSARTVPARPPPRPSARPRRPARRRSRRARRHSATTMSDIPRRRLGDSDLEVSEISLGSWLTYAGGVERDQTEACTRAAFDAGINFFDTANAYGRGAAESAWGEILADYPRDSFVLATTELTGDRSPLRDLVYAKKLLVLT